MSSTSRRRWRWPGRFQPRAGAPVVGTPSATATFDTEVFYYISQERTRSVAFMKPKLVNQSIMAVYFDKDGVVSRIAHYKLQDGRVFDMIHARPRRPAAPK